LLPIAVLFHADNEIDKDLADSFAAGVGMRKEVGVRRFSINAEIDKKYLTGCWGIAFIFPAENHSASLDMYNFICKLDIPLEGKLGIAVNTDESRQSEMMMINQLLSKGMLVYEGNSQNNNSASDNNPLPQDNSEKNEDDWTPEGRFKKRGKIFSEKLLELFG
jgi:hypothetical protein